MTVLRRAMASSVVIRRLRRIADGSRVYAAVAAWTRWVPGRRWLRETERRIVVGLGGAWSGQEEIRTVERLDALVSTSKVAAVLSGTVMAPILASRDARLRRLFHSAGSLDLPAKVRTGSCAIIVAVLTHTVLLAVIGVPVHLLGWSLRVGLGAAGALGLWRPEAVAAAWRDRQIR